MVVKIIEGKCFADYSKQVLSTKKPTKPREKTYKLPGKYGKADGKLEGEVLSEVKKMFDLHKIWYKRIDSTGKLAKHGKTLTMVPGSAKGFPDMVAGYNGVFYLIELKKKGGNYSAVQLNMWKDLYRHAGMTVLIATDAKAITEYILKGVYPEGFELIEDLFPIL